MKIQKRRWMPSFRMQIALLFLALLLLAVLFTRTFFLQSYYKYLDQIRSGPLTTGLRQMHDDFKPQIPAAQRPDFSRQAEQLLVEVNRINLFSDFYRREVTAYSVYIIVFIASVVMIIFLFSLYSITLPLQRLQAATRALSRGESHVQLKESPFSPLNNLLQSFNQMAADLADQRQRAIEAEKKLLWREIARVMAHEIKNPLTPIKLTVERLEHKAAHDPASATAVLSESLAIIHEEISNLQALVDRFKDFAALPEASPIRYDLTEQVREIVQHYDHHQQCTLVLADGLPFIRADKMQLRQVIVNLLQNALQAIPPDGRVAIELTRCDDAAMLQITDTGSGIDPAHLERIFEPYFTTKRKGTGLGLAIVRQIVDNHNGRIEVQSQLNQGTVFRIRLPLPADTVNRQEELNR